MLRRVERRLFPRRRVRRLLPEEIDRAVDQLPEEDREEVRVHIERDFASYLRGEHARHEPNARRSLWGTYDTIIALLGGAARELTRRLFGQPG